MSIPIKTKTIMYPALELDVQEQQEVEFGRWMLVARRWWDRACGGSPNISSHAVHKFPLLGFILAPTTGKGRMCPIPHCNKPNDLL